MRMFTAQYVPPQKVNTTMISRHRFWCIEMSDVAAELTLGTTKTRSFFCEALDLMSDIDMLLFCTS